jgi:hypothetical protein
MTNNDNKTKNTANFPAGVASLLKSIEGMSSHDRNRSYFKNHISLLFPQIEGHLRRNPADKDYLHAALITGLMRYKKDIDDETLAVDISRFLHAHGEYLAKNFKAEDVAQLTAPYTHPEQATSYEHTLDPELVNAAHQTLLRHCFALEPLMSAEEVLDIGFGHKPLPPQSRTGKLAQEDRNARKALEVLELCSPITEKKSKSMVRY